MCPCFFYGVPSMAQFLLRVIIIKQWKRSQTIFKNLMKLNHKFRCGFSDVDIFKCANTRGDIFPKLSGLGLQYEEARPVMERYKAELVRNHNCEICVPIQKNC